jgi:hypothetical protein
MAYHINPKKNYREFVKKIKMKGKLRMLLFHQLLVVLHHFQQKPVWRDQNRDSLSFHVLTPSVGQHASYN